MWGGRFTKRIDDAFAWMNASFGFDWRLYDADIRGSIAYAKALAQVNILSNAERDALIDGLRRVKAEFDADTFEAKEGDEDIHSAVERRLSELIGAVAGKLHTGRSRNDQVATDARLYTFDAIQHIVEAIRDVQRALIERAEEHIDVLMSGYTHMQRAQPILFAHWLMSFFWMLQRDVERLEDCTKRVLVLPLGAGALAGNAFGIDREFLAHELKFSSISENSVDAVSDRDFIAEFLFDAALLGAHLSRLAEDVILYTTAEFGFLKLDDAYATGSSLMPQKKNPDALELARGKSARLIGNLSTLLVALKGLPSSYNKDLQEDKEPLFDTIDTLDTLLPVIAGVIRTMRIDAHRMRAAIDPAMMATDLADVLVRYGIPFREAHRLVGEAVKLAETRDVSLAQLTSEDFTNIALEFGVDVSNVFDPMHSIAMREVRGATGSNAVREQIIRAHAALDK